MVHQLIWKRQMFVCLSASLFLSYKTRPSVKLLHEHTHTSLNETRASFLLYTQKNNNNSNICTYYTHFQLYFNAFASLLVLIQLGCMHTLSFKNSSCAPMPAACLETDESNDQSPYPLFRLHHLYKMYTVVCTFILFPI